MDGTGAILIYIATERISDGRRSRLATLALAACHLALGVPGAERELRNNPWNLNDEIDFCLE